MDLKSIVSATVLSAGMAIAAQEGNAFVAPTSFAAEIEQTDCPFEVVRGDAASCFSAHVPLHYSDVGPDGILPEDAPRLTLAVAVLENFITAEDPNPIVMISGGPGQGAIAFWQEHAGSLHLRRNRSIVLIDQRGTGFSTPSLQCDEASQNELDDNRLNDPDLSPEISLTERLRNCGRYWREQGVDFNAFDTRSAALDLMAIRRGFGLAQWNLHGTSYGARVVADALRVDPEGIRSAVLNSPQGIFSHYDEDFARSRKALFEQLYADCAADEYCSREYGDLEAHLLAIHDRLGDEGMEIYLRNPQDGALVRIQVGWPDVLIGLEGHMRFSFSAEPIARYIHELARVVEGRLNLNDDEIARLFQASLIEDDFGMAIGMHLAVRCREDVPGYSAELAAELAQADEFYYPFGGVLGDFYAACDAWQTEPVEPQFLELVRSDIPTLVLTGDMDSLTPTIWAERTAAALVNGQLVSFRGMAHDIYGTSICAKAITANFLDAPYMPVDDSCALDYRPVFTPVQR